MFNDKFDEPGLPLVVVLSYSDWHEAPRIRHQVTRQLVRFFNVIYVVKHLDNRADSFERISERLLIYAPGISAKIPKRLYANDPLTHHLVNLYFKKKIMQVLGHYNCKNTIVVNFIYDFIEIMQSSFFAYKIYVCFDEFPKMRRRVVKKNRAKSFFQEKLFQYYENLVARSADLCLATHVPLKEKLFQQNANTKLFLPGHEFNRLPKPFVKKKNGPISVGFMGYINYELKIDWLKIVANDPNFELFMIGPLENFDVSSIYSNDKNNYIPALQGAELIKMLEKMDVLIIPYIVDLPETRIQTAPNKLFQYIAMGKPVVISVMPHFISMPYGVIYRATDADDFIAQIKKAFYEDCVEFYDLRLRIAAENTWDKRGEFLKVTIESHIF